MYLCIAGMKMKAWYVEFNVGGRFIRSVLS